MKKYSIEFLLGSLMVLSSSLLAFAPPSHDSQAGATPYYQVSAAANASALPCTK